jgi:HSP20 family molecular chaperone IbpA
MAVKTEKEKKGTKETREVTPVERTGELAKAPQEGGIERTRSETYVTPDADIYETDEALVLVADVPGVPREAIEVRTENGVLEITAHRKRPEPREPSYAEIRPSSYYRAFRLSREIDASKIEAKLTDGVLALTLPKSPEAKPQKIEVTSG